MGGEPHLGQTGREEEPPPKHPYHRLVQPAEKIGGHLGCRRLVGQIGPAGHDLMQPRPKAPGRQGAVDGGFAKAEQRQAF